MRNKNEKVGLLSFMQDDQFTTGSITTSAKCKKALAQASLSYNVKNATFKALFPDWVEEEERRRKKSKLPEVKIEETVNTGNNEKTDIIWMTVTLVAVVAIAIGVFGVCIHFTKRKTDPY